MRAGAIIDGDGCGESFEVHEIEWILQASQEYLDFLSIYVRLATYDALLLNLLFAVQYHVIRNIVDGKYSIGAAPHIIIGIIDCTSILFF